MKFLGPPSSGSIAGTTSSHNRAGQYTRNRRSPVQPVGTGRRAVVRGNFGACSSAWAGLASFQQPPWSAFADSHPVTDSLGQAVKLTGHQMYVAVNCNLLNAGAAQSAVPPIATTTPVLGSVVFTATETGPTLTLSATLTSTGLAGDYILVAFSAPKGNGISFCKTFWQCSVVAGDSVTISTQGVAYKAQFGLPGSGNKIFFRLTPVNQYGWAGTPTSGFVTVV